MPFGDDALKKAMKKGNIPPYIFDAAFGFFNGDENVPKAKLRDGETFETVFVSFLPKNSTTLLFSNTS